MGETKDFFPSVLNVYEPDKAYIAVQKKGSSV